GYDKKHIYEKIFHPFEMAVNEPEELKPKEPYGKIVDLMLRKAKGEHCMSNRWLMREERNDVPDAKHLEKVFHVKHERVCRNSVLTTGLQVFVVNFDDASPAPRADSADPHSNEVEGEVAIG